MNTPEDHGVAPVVEIKVRDDGPYKITGPVRLVDADGTAFDVPADRPLALCRCGRSATKPFCDKSHRATGFRSCVRVERGEAVGPDA